MRGRDSWVTEVANSANHRSIWPNPAAPAWWGSIDYVSDAVWQPCIAGVTATCRTVPRPPQPPGGGPTGTPNGGTPAGRARRLRPPPPVRHPPESSSVKVAVAPATLSVPAKAGSRVVGTKVVHVSAVGTRRITIELNRRGRRMLRKAGRLMLAVKLYASSPEGRPTTVTRSVTLRRR